MLAPSTLRVGVGLNAAPVAVIDGTGTLRIDPAVLLLNTANPAIAPTIASQSVAMPALRTVSAGLGGTPRGEALGPTGSLVILVVGLPGGSFQAPGIADPAPARWNTPAPRTRSVPGAEFESAAYSITSPRC